MLINDNVTKKKSIKLLILSYYHSFKRQSKFLNKFVIFITSQI